MSAGESKTADVIFFNNQGGVVGIKVTAEDFRTVPISFLLAMVEKQARLRIKDETYYLYTTYIDENGQRVLNTPVKPTLTLEHINQPDEFVYICVSTVHPMNTSREAYGDAFSEYGIPRAVPLRM